MNIRCLQAPFLENCEWTSCALHDKQSRVASGKRKKKIYIPGRLNLMCHQDFLMGFQVCPPLTSYTKPFLSLLSFHLRFCRVKTNAVWSKLSKEILVVISNNTGETKHLLQLQFVCKNWSTVASEKNYENIFLADIQAPLLVKTLIKSKNELQFYVKRILLASY